ncbi:MAG: hypothetical protein IGS48_19195 [Oscillatoriales cyanobacterium C42_A2020_001]|nr:hypothetical protein [Leptolyngbyaceae cyanobacterium C42_A2020_001]
MKQNNVATVKQGEYLKLFIIFFVLFAILTVAGPVGWNDQSRMAQIQSLVEHGSFIIDKSIFLVTGDKYFFNNHFYSDKPPILALYASPFYFALKQLGLSFEKNIGLTYYLLTLLSIGILSILGLIIFRKILDDFFLVSKEWANITTFIAGVGTLILPYSLVFNNHVPSGVLILLGFYFLLHFRESGRYENAVFSGFFISLSGTIDINCFLFIPFMFVPFIRRSIKAAFIFGISCIPAIALYLFLNLYTSGSFIPPAMNASLWNYPGSSFSQENLSGLAQHNGILDVLFYAFHMLLGSRGLISHTPILLFSILSILIMYKKKRLEYKTEYSYALLAILFYIAIYITRTINYSGWGFGIRWFASLMLILCLPIAYIENEIRLSKPIRILFFSTACLSIFVSIIGAYNPISPLSGTELQERLFPTNTILMNFKSLIKDSLDIVLASPSIGEIFRMIRLVFGASIIYFLLYRFMKKLEPTYPDNQKL